MTAIGLILGRELKAYSRSAMGLVIVAAVLLVDGLLFNAFALGQGSKKSSEVLTQFFYFSSGTTMIASVFIAMRLLAEERQTGTLPLLMSAPVADAQIVVGKFLSAFVFLGAMTALTVYMPLLILVNGSVAPGHLVAGYLGLLLLGAASLAIGVFGSALAPNQVVAAVVTAGILVMMLVAWLLGYVTERPLNDVFGYLALWHKHFQPFRDGMINVRDVVYYVAVVYVFLHAATRVLAARRWR